MLMDTLSQFSLEAGDDLSSTGDSTNILDVNLSASIGNELYLHVVPTVDFAGTSVKFSLETAATAAGLSSPTILFASGALTAAQVNAGWYARVPAGNLGFLQVSWVTVSGTAGTADIFLSPSVQDQSAVEA